LYLEYGHARPVAPDADRGQALLEKTSVNDAGRLSIFEKEMGPCREGFGIQIAARAKWRLMPNFEPPFEVYGDIAGVKNLDAPRISRHQIGPVGWESFD